MSYTPLVSPVFTGNPRVPTATTGDNDTSAASTGFVQQEITAGDFVGRTNTQTITGAKTFDADVTLSDNKVIFDDMATAASVILNADVTGDTQKRLAVEASGKMTWGSGSAAGDVVLERTAANVLELGSGDYLRVSTTPTNANDVVNKSYADSLSSGLDVKVSVRVATTADLSATRTSNTLTASANGALSVDGVSPIVGDRILVKNESTGADNGIYVVTATGDGSNPFVLDRADDADGTPSNEVSPGMFTFVEEGTVNADTGWVLVTNGAITVNTTSLTFTQFASTSPVTTLDSLTDVVISSPADGQLLRYESGSSDWRNTALVTVNDAGALVVPTTGSSAGLIVGGDVNLYRSAANIWKTDDSIQVAGDNIEILSAATSGFIRTGAATTSNAYRARVSGDAGWRHTLLSDGKHEWGDGSGANDTNLYRSSADVLKTDDTFSVNSNVVLQSSGNIVMSAGSSLIDINSLTAASTVALRAKVSGDSQQRVQLQADGKLLWGSGALTADTNLYRNAADTLKTDDAFIVAGKLTGLAGFSQAVTTKSANYSVALATDNVILVDTNAAAGAVTITLPATHTAGDTIQVKDSGGMAETKNIIVDPADADLVDGASTFTINVNYMAVSFVSDGTNWYVL